MPLDLESRRRYRRTLAGAEQWLSGHFPDSLLGFADRFLTRSFWANSKAAQADLARLQENCDLLIDVCQAQAATQELHHDLTAVLALAYSWKRLQIPQYERLRSIVAPVAQAWVSRAAHWQEPSRSMFHFAVGALDIAPLQPPGLRPEDSQLAAYLDLHRIMFATDYGRRLARRSTFQEVLRRLEGDFAEPAVWGNADLCAERLLIEHMLDPTDLSACQTYADQLHALHRPDGGFGTVDIDTHNHTVAVAAAALGWLLEKHG